MDTPDAFALRHIGPSPEEQAEMLRSLGLDSLDALVRETVPASIRLGRPLDLPAPLAEHELLAELSRLASKNRVLKSYLGLGYHDCTTPPVILRNVLENPGWYTQYTPYQAEIAQGRLEALLNYQTLICDLTGLPVANSSLLDEATAAAEAMTMAAAVKGVKTAPGASAPRAFWVSQGCHPQTIEVVRTRAGALGIPVVVGDPARARLDRSFFGALLQYPDTDGRVADHAPFIAAAHAADALAIVAADPLALVLLRPPGEMGADIAVGSTQRFGVPLGFGGPHAAYLACREEIKRQMPGRIVGVSKDKGGRPALRLALQTREQHIRREKATSNICTAQVLLAVTASMYAVWHGPEGLARIARRVHRHAAVLASGLRRLGWEVGPERFFDTLVVQAGRGRRDALLARALERGYNLRRLGEDGIVIALDETTGPADLADLWQVFAQGQPVDWTADRLAEETEDDFEPPFARTSPILQHPVFHRHRSETEMLRYIRRLESRDLSLVHSMIPLGSCTMKLNATAEMQPVTWPAFGKLHPYAPRDQAAGYLELFAGLEAWLSEITGLPAVSLQPNAGSQGEYTGLLVIRRWHEERGQAGRTVCLIPQSAHGTNPASAVMAGLQVVVVACDSQGEVDRADLEAKAAAAGDRLAALMVTYPSTHGVFEESIREVCRIVHAHGGQVYMDGANMNAQVGLCRPGDMGADVCHLNLHKTFCIPHGGGGPGMGPIAVAAHLAPHLPRHPVTGGGPGDALRVGPVSAAPWSSASILPIPWAYIRMMGPEGLAQATRVAILSANYVARRLDPHYPVLYRGAAGRVAHECIVDLRPLKKSAGVEAEDVAKRLMDYGFHAPTLSFPVPGTMMIEPTESECQAEIDRFCEAMIRIREEVARIERGEWDRQDNPLKHAPHTALAIASEWKHAYSREEAAFPAPWTREHKFWPVVGRIDNVAGDRNLVCACPPVEDYAPEDRR